MSLSIKCSGDSVDTDSGTEGIDIRIPVTHDDHSVLSRNYLSESMCLHTGLDPRILLYLLALATEVCNLISLLNHSLVTAST